MASNKIYLGELLNQVGERNRELLISEPLGVSIDKEFMPSVANTIGTDLSKYMLLRENYFACNPMHVGRDRALPIARYKKSNPGIVSPAYFTFVVDESKVDLDYLELFFKLDVFDKECWFYTDSTVRGGLSWDALCGIPLNLPSREDQQKIATIAKLMSKCVASLTEQNNHLAKLCEAMASRYCDGGDASLNDICYQVSERRDCADADLATYVSTESLLQNKQGRQMASSLPAAGKVTCYKAGDTLVSNIRPYFKKVWYAPFDGTCSGDVLVFRANEDALASYLHACLRQDRFFDHIMRGAKGTKMPRGDKKQLMEFIVSSVCEPQDLVLLNVATRQITANASESDKLTELRDALLPKLMAGEIDVSKVEI